MSWLAVDKNGQEYIYEHCPKRGIDTFIPAFTPFESNLWSPLPKGSIKKLIGKDLTWKDDPVEYNGD